MATIFKTVDEPLRREESFMNIPAMEIPSFRMHLAVEAGIDRKMLFLTGGGLGDNICAEPVFRWALDNFKDCEISLGTGRPELFRHLPFKKVYAEPNEKPNLADYHVFRAMPGHEGLNSEFLCHMFCHCVDYISLSMFKCQLPVKGRSIRLIPSAFEHSYSSQLNETDIAVHAGVTWQSRTFPKWWWDEVIYHIREMGCRPVLVGAKSADDRSTVDVDAEGCLDLRDKLSVMESVAVLQKARVLLSNDSAPIHMAASGNAHIGFVSTARDGGCITHWRNGEFGWRMHDFTVGSAVENYTFCPNTQGIGINKIDPEKLLAYLPKPFEFAKWGVEKCLHTQTHQ